MAARGRRQREGCGEQRKVQAARGSQQEAQVWPLYSEEPEPREDRTLAGGGGLRRATACICQESRGVS